MKTVLQIENHGLSNEDQILPFGIDDTKINRYMMLK